MFWSSHIRFLPWVGGSFEHGLSLVDQGEHVKVLIVGESHYLDGSHDDNGEKTFTNDVVRNYLTPKGQQSWKPSKFWTVLGRTIAGRDTYSRIQFWNEIAYYVFVQDFAGDGPRQRPTDQMWKDSYPQFSEVIEKLAPQKVIILGDATWRHVNDAIPGANTGVLKVDDFTCEVTHVPHLSSYGFRSDDHYPDIFSFILGSKSISTFWSELENNLIVSLESELNEGWKIVRDQNMNSKWSGIKIIHTNNETAKYSFRLERETSFYHGICSNSKEGLSSEETQKNKIIEIIKDLKEDHFDSGESEEGGHWLGFKHSDHEYKNVKEVCIKIAEDGDQFCKGIIETFVGDFKRWKERLIEIND